MRKISLRTIAIIVMDYNYNLSKENKPFAKKYEELYDFHYIDLYEDGTLYNNMTKKNIKTSLDKYGYVKVIINKKSYALHRLVALGFVHWDYENTLVCHKNKCRTDNRALNLMWTNNNFINIRRDNFETPNRGRGVFAFTKEFEFIDFYENAGKAEKALGVNRSEIYRCCKGERRSTGNYTFRYSDLRR